MSGGLSSAPSSPTPSPRGLLATICAIVIVTLKSGSEALAATGLKDLAILVAGGLLGLKTPKP